MGGQQELGVPVGGERQDAHPLAVPQATLATGVRVFADDADPVAEDGL
jgi:hypothetical protein